MARRMSDKQRKAMFASLYRRGVLDKTTTKQVVDIHQMRMPKSKKADERTTANRTFHLHDPDGRAMWANNPAKYDITGVDDKQLGMRIEKQVAVDDERIKAERAAEYEMFEAEDYEPALLKWHFETHPEKYGLQPDDEWLKHAIAEAEREEKMWKAMEEMKRKEDDSSAIADKWLKDVTTEVENLRRGNEELLMKKQLTDRYIKALKNGEITREQAAKALQEGKILDPEKYNKALSIEKKIDAVKARKIRDTAEVTTLKPAPIVDRAIKYAADRLKFDADNLPKEYKPPVEYSDEDVKRYTWGIPENEALKRYEANELSRYKRAIDNFDSVETKFGDVSQKWNKLSKNERKLAENDTLRYDYYSLKRVYDESKGKIPFWRKFVQKIESGEWMEINRSHLRGKYSDEVKAAIKKGKPVPFDIIKQYPEFVKSQNSRERYEKGRHTSFSNVSIAVDESRKDVHGIKVKLQNGKPMTERAADQIVLTLKQFQNAVGDITSIMKNEDLTIAHTSGKHPFLSKAAGMYHPWEKTVTMGYPGVAAHEYGHFIDETAKKNRDVPKYDFDLLARAKVSFNSGVEKAIALSKNKTKEELDTARDLRVRLGPYWTRPEEIFARMVEQYTAYKNKDLPYNEHYLTNQSYKDYTNTPAYWDHPDFENLVPALEAEINRKIALARAS